MESLPPTPVPVSPPSRRRRGFTLVLTLIVLSAITLLVLGLFANVSSESATANNYDHAFRAQTAVRSGLARVEALLQRGTWSDDYLVLEHLQNPPPSNTTPTDEQWRNRQPVLTLARARITGDTTLPNGYTATWEYTPLTSGVQPPPPTSGTPSLPTTPLVAREDAQTKKPLEVATALPKQLPWQTSQNTFWEVIYEDRDEDNNPATPSVRVPVARYAFHVEDLQGLLSLDHAGNPGDAVENATGMLSRNHEREKFEVFESVTDARLTSPRLWYAGLAPGMRTPDDDPLTDDRRWVMSQSALYSLLEPTATSDTTQIDNQLMVARHVVKAGSPTQVTSLLMGPDAWKPILMKEDITNAWPTLLQRNNAADAGNDRGRLPTGPGRRLEENTITGLRPYHEMPLIPVEPGVFANPREPKMNLNRVLETLQAFERDPGNDSDEVIQQRHRSVIEIAQKINKHLPNFSYRGGNQFTLQSNFGEPHSYLQNIAAGILDYADTDSYPTIKDGLTPETRDVGYYRGMDSYPLVNEFFYFYKHEGFIEGSPRKQKIGYTIFVELWNMSNRTVTGEYEAEVYNKATVSPPGNRTFLNSVSDILENPPEGDAGGYWVKLCLPSSNNDGLADPLRRTITLRPNEHVVLACPRMLYHLEAGLSFSDESGTEIQDNVVGNGFRVRFKESDGNSTPLLFGQQRHSAPPRTKPFVVIDRCRGNLEANRRVIAFNYPELPKQRGISFYPGQSYGRSGSFVSTNCSDPRGAFYINAMISAVNYNDGSSPWGRNIRNNVIPRSARSAPSSHKLYGGAFPSRWGDLGHDLAPFGVTDGTDPGADVNHPSNHARAGEPNHPFSPQVLALRSTSPASAWMNGAPTRISNSGRFFSVTELGNIFDPLMWNPDVVRASTSTLEQAGLISWEILKNISNRAVGSTNWCGGHTLRIGRPEHPQFRWNHQLDGTKPDRSYAATALLDVFHTGQPFVGSVVDGTEMPKNLRDLTGPLVWINGQVNLNTATRDVLRAIVAGAYVADPAIMPSSNLNSALRPPQETSTQADKLVDAIIRARPFISPGQVADKTRALSNKPIFGDPTEQRNWSSTTSEWNDAAAEEAFARVYNSGTVRSRNFRVHVTGQAIRNTRSNLAKIEVLSTRSRVFHVSLTPVRDPITGVIQDQRIQITHEQDL